MSYDPKTLASFRQRLQARRKVVVESTVRGQRELEELMGQDRPAEMEEDAQSSAAEFVLARLSENQRREVAQIDGALARIDAGTYGECVECGAMISIERLKAVPYALRDAGCTAQYEAREHPGREYPSL